MKNDLYFDFFKSLIHSHQIKYDEFFSNEIIDKTKDYLETDYCVFYRQLSKEEQRLITTEAFQLLLFWVKTDEISIDFFERFLTILVSFDSRISFAIDVDTLPTIIEMISLVDYKDHVIYTTLEIYVNSPEILTKRFNIIH